MNKLESKITDLLKDLKENYCAVGIKTEFETESDCSENLLRLKDFVNNANLNLTVKIGGCGAIRDLYESQRLDVKTIVAPMIETPYAMKKYMNAAKLVFSGKERKSINFLINIETVTGYNNYKKIINSADFNSLSGIVLGRSDLAASMGIKEENINSFEILTIAKNLSEAMQKEKKEMIVGGSISVDSISFFRELPYITKFETRKVIFDAKKALKNKQMAIGILKALDFERLYIKYKIELSENLLKVDTERLKILEIRYKKALDALNNF